MPQQRSEIDPQASWLQYFVDALHVFNHVVSRIYKETRDHAIPLASLLSVDFNKFACHHGKVIGIAVFTHNFVWTDIGNHYTFKGVFLSDQIGKVVDEWKKLEGVLFLGDVENEVRRQQAEVGEFIALGLVSPDSELKDQSTQSAARMNH